MLDRIATLAIAAPRRIIAIAVLVMVGAAIFGIPVTKSLANGGFQDPTSESWHASRLLSDKFGLGDNQMIIAVTSYCGGAQRGRTGRRHRSRCAVEEAALRDRTAVGLDHAAAG